MHRDTLLDIAWTCPCCGRQFSGLPMAYAFAEPDAWHTVPLEQRASRGVLGTDTCTVDGRHFIRGRIVAAVAGAGEFIWGVWAEVSKQSFARFGELWDVRLREHEPPLPGALANEIPLYPPTLNLTCRIRLQNRRARPIFAIEAADHPLAREQRDGMSLDRVKEIAALVFEHRK